MKESIRIIEPINSWGYKINSHQVDEGFKLKVILINQTINKEIKISVIKNVKGRLAISAYVAILNSNKGDDMIFFERYAQKFDKPLFGRIKELEQSNLDFNEKLIEYLKLLHSHSDKELKKILSTEYWTKKYYFDPREVY